MLRIHLLQQWFTPEQILEGVNQMLSEKGVMLRDGTILDAMIIAAPSSTKNKRKERDPEMHLVATGNQWFYCCAEGFAYGMRCHIGVDAASGLVHSVVSTAANVHELNIGRRPAPWRGTPRLRRCWPHWH
jgi:IS5 family transposase